ncbi:Glycosyltransferase AglG [uncultured archaeon]|nr:Glycosyltransferase AglG [uncultured archaeon]
MVINKDNSTGIKVSVIISTYNRKDLLKKCIVSLFNQNYSEDKYEIIVIDSSTDGTAETIRELSKYAPSEFRYIYRENIGLSVARNLGIEEARGEIIVYIDDDAEADVEWLNYIVEAYNDSDVCCVGGRILPKFDSMPSRWFSRKMWGWVGLLDLGDEKKIVNKGKIQEYPIGCNVSFRKSIFERIGIFREDVGRSKDTFLSYEETELCDRILLAGYKIIYEPRVMVQHFIPRDKTNLNYFIKRYYYQGVSEAKIGSSISKNLLHLARIFINPITFLFKRDFNYLFLIFRSVGFINQSMWSVIQCQFRHM